MNTTYEEGRDDHASKDFTGEFFHRALTICSAGPSQPAETGPHDAEAEPKSIDPNTGSRHYHEVMGSVGNLCLAATGRYLRERQINGVMRSGGRMPPSSGHRTFTATTPAWEANNSRGRRTSNRFAPYARPPPSPRSTGERTYVPEEEEEDAQARLLSNISEICTQMWMQALRDRLYVPQAERTAVENMGHLLRWGDTVVFGAGGMNPNEGEGCDTQAILAVLAAGKNLCRWLGYEEGVTWLEAGIEH